MRRYFHDLYKMYRASNVVVSMPKTGSSSLADYLNALHLHSLYGQEATIANRALINGRFRLVLKGIYSFLLRVVLAKKKRQYFSVFRDEPSRLLSSFEHDLAYIYLYCDKKGIIDSRNPSADQAVVMAEAALDLNFRRRWIEDFIRYFKLNDKDADSLIKMCSGSGRITIMTCRGSLTLVGISRLSEEFGLHVWRNNSKDRPFRITDNARTALSEYISGAK